MHIRFDGYEIGCTHDSEVFIATYEIGETEIDTYDTARLGTDGVMPGTDYLRDAQWVFALTAHGQDGTKGVLEKLAPLERAWKAWANRTKGRVPLEYSTGHDGVWHKIYGRPRQYLPPRPDAQTAKGRGRAQLTFMQQDSLHYSLATQQQTLKVAPGASGGITVPITIPLQVARTGGTTDRHAVNNGDADAPVTLVFNGPVRDPQVALQGRWQFQINGSLEWDEYLVVDGLHRTAYVYSTTRPDNWSNQRAAYSMIANGSRFTDLTIPPGTSSLQFTAIDDTYTASVDVSWPHTFVSMQ